MRRTLLSTFLLGLLASFAVAFVPKTVSRPSMKLDAFKIDGRIAAVAGIIAANAPLIAQAEEDYEYGAVNAPGGLALALGVGILAIATAAVPVLLKPGEEAFEEIKERDSSTFGKDTSDVLKSRKK